MSDSQGEKLAYLDALRGIAVLMVILVHTSQPVRDLSGPLHLLASYGQLGVQLFFVVSAFTLCLSHERRSGEPLPLVSFYVRRLFRIAPLYWLGIPLCFAFSALVFRNTSSYTLNNILANAAFVHGFVPSANNSVVFGGWSIAAEMTFYAIFPLLFAGVARFGKRAWMAAFAGAAIALAVDLQLNVSLGKMENNGFYYFSFLNQLPVFIIGMGMYAMHRDRGLTTTVAAGVFALCTAASLWLLTRPAGISYALLPAVSAFGFGGLLMFLSRLQLKLTWLTKFGSVSFSMYITHFVFAWTVSRALNKVASGLLPPWAVLAISYALVVALAYAVSRVTERAVEARGIATGARLIRALRARAGQALSPVGDEAVATARK